MADEDLTRALPTAKDRKKYLQRVKEVVLDLLRGYPDCDCPDKNAYGESPVGDQYAGYPLYLRLCQECQGYYCPGDYPDPPRCPNCGHQDVFEAREEGHWYCEGCCHVWHATGMDGHPDGPFPDPEKEDT